MSCVRGSLSNSLLSKSIRLCHPDPIRLVCKANSTADWRGPPVSDDKARIQDSRRWHFPFAFVSCLPLEMVRSRRDRCHCERFESPCILEWWFLWCTCNLDICLLRYATLVLASAATVIKGSYRHGSQGQLRQHQSEAAMATVLRQMQP